MARLLFFALVAGALWYGWHLFRRQQGKVAEVLKRAEGTLTKNEPVDLERDPKTGVYRPADRDD
jgi:hypothetical protein